MKQEKKKENIEWREAYNDLVEWLKSSAGVVFDNMPDDEDKVEFATACGYIICCKEAIAMANDIIKRTGRGEDR